MQKTLPLLPKLADFLKILGIALAGGLLLEAATLLGSPVRSPIAFCDWCFQRIVFFFVLSFILVWCAWRFDWKYRLCKNLAACKRFLARRGKQLGIVIAASAGAAALVTIALSRYSQPLPMGLFFFSFFFIVGLMITFRNSLASRFEWFFLATVLSLGFAVAAFAPATINYCMDDYVHFDRALALSYLGQADYTKAEASLAGAIEDYSVDDAHFSLSKESEMQNKLNAQFTDDQVIKTTTGETLCSGSILQYSTIGYIPNATGLWLGRLLHLSFSAQFKLGQLMNLLFFSLIVFAGLRKLRSKKLLIGAIALMPTCLFLSVNYAYDPWLTAWTAYVFASFISLLQQKDTPVEPADLIKIVTALVVGLAPKAVYAPLALIFLAAPKAKFTGRVSRRTWNITFIGIFLFACATFVLPLFSGPVTQSVYDSGSVVNGGEQLRGVLANPVSYLKMLGLFMFSFITQNSDFNTFAGIGYVGGINAMEQACFLTLIIIALLDSAKDSLPFAKLSYRLWTFACVIGALALISTSMYIAFTPVGMDAIAGVQGRYIYPLLIPLFALGLNFKLENKGNPNVLAAGCWGTSLLIAYVTFGLTVISRFAI